MWLMRQAGRYMPEFRECAGSCTSKLTGPGCDDPCSSHSLSSSAARRYSDRLPFRERSENADIATELSLQPWRAFRPDGVIMFSDILTPLPVLGIEFDIIKGRGPVIQTPISRCRHCLLSSSLPSLRAEGGLLLCCMWPW